MGEFLGTTGGLLMVLLIVVLLLHFLIEMGIKLDSKELFKVLVPVFCIGIIELMLAGIYYNMLSGGTSLLDIGTIWGNYPLKLQQFWPFNWYISLGMGTYSFWNLYQVLKRAAGVYWSEKIMYLVLASPFLYYTFLPMSVSYVFFLVSVILRFAAYLLEDKGLQKIRGIVEGKRIKAADIISPVLFTFLAVLSGAVIMINTKV